MAPGQRSCWSSRQDPSPRRYGEPRSRPSRGACSARWRASRSACDRTSSEASQSSLFAFTAGESRPTGRSSRRSPPAPRASNRPSSFGNHGVPREGRTRSPAWLARKTERQPFGQPLPPSRSDCRLTEPSLRLRTTGWFGLRSIAETRSSTMRPISCVESSTCKESRGSGWHVLLPLSHHVPHRHAADPPRLPFQPREAHDKAPYSPEPRSIRPRMSGSRFPSRPGRSRCRRRGHRWRPLVGSPVPALLHLALPAPRCSLLRSPLTERRLGPRPTRLPPRSHHLQVPSLSQRSP